jgi:hypothetical protein
MSKTRWGTGYFTSKAAAVAYFAAQNIDREGVEEKLRKGEIKIGFPPLKDGQRAVVIDEGKRYAIEEED